MKYYNNIKEIITDITKNKLMFNNSLTKDGYKKSIGHWSSYGNLTNIHMNGVPVVIINLSPTFNIPTNKINISNKILNKIIKSADILPYITYIYKNNIFRKSVVLESEFSYNCIKHAHDEFIYILNNIYRNYDNVLFIYLGKYIEYRYLNNMINTYNNNNNINIHEIYNHHISQFINDTDFNNNKILLDDIDRIKRKISSINKGRITVS